jgi:intergrase/recombinase
MNKPIPAITRFREKFYYLIPNKDQIKKNTPGVIYPNTMGDIEAFLESELLNERERILKEVDDKVIGDYQKKIALPVMQIQEQNNFEKEIRNDLRLEQRMKLADLLAELKEGGEI